MPIRFYFNKVNDVLHQKKKLKQWLQDVVYTETKRTQIDINIVFCTDDILLDMNKQYLEHDYYTDILTFPIETTEKKLNAELYISVDRVRDNAQQIHKSFELELYRVMVHGILHLCGYNDASESERKIMQKKEDKYLALYTDVSRET